ncbi:ABC transporter permease [Mesorhizobium tianshanense]|nr:ABC transporter permease [Mesorhizobium tianshanense]
MMTFASILVAVPLSCAAGFSVAVVVFGNRKVEAATLVILDFMQTVPIFAYLLPILFLFGFSPVSAMLGTMIYSMPAMVRTTLLAFKTTSDELIELGRVVGATKRQMIRKILVPSSRPLLTVGMNQVVVLSLNAVIIASIIGAGGLGFDVLKALRTLNTGRGLEAGFAIVLMAISLDRLSIAYTQRVADSPVRNRGWIGYLVTGIAIAILAMGASYIWPFARSVPAEMQLSIAPYVAKGLDYVTITYGDAIDTFTGFMYIYLLNPIRDIVVGLPWLFVVFGLSVVAWKLGGPRLLITIVALLAFILLTGFWRASMTTVYLIGISVTISLLLGLPLGIAGALNDRMSAVLGTICNTLQTLPSFVYLVPVVMLFHVGDVPAIIAVVLYAVTPVIRYTDMGIRRVDPGLLEGAKAMGASRIQTLLKIRLPMAMPEILLGLNQTIMLAISMLVVTALVGTQDLGQEVYIGLSRADTGRGLVAGICVASLSIIVDRLIQTYANRQKRALGLE